MHPQCHVYPQEIAGLIEGLLTLGVVAPLGCRIPGFEPEAARRVGDCCADFITSWSTTEPKDTSIFLLSHGWYTPENERLVHLKITQLKRKIIIIWTKSPFLWGLQPLIFQGDMWSFWDLVFAMWSMTESIYERFDMFLNSALHRKKAMFTPNLLGNGMIYIYVIWYLRYHVDMYLCCTVYTSGKLNEA